GLGQGRDSRPRAAEAGDDAGHADRDRDQRRPGPGPPLGRLRPLRPRPLSRGRLTLPRTTVRRPSRGPGARPTLPGPAHEQAPTWARKRGVLSRGPDRSRDLTPHPWGRFSNPRAPAALVARVARLPHTGVRASPPRLPGDRSRRACGGRSSTRLVSRGSGESILPNSFCVRAKALLAARKRAWALSRGFRASRANPGLADGYRSRAVGR